MAAFSAAYWIEKLQLSGHIEGGYYTRTYTAEHILPKAQLPAGFHGDRPVTTAIYFLLQKHQFSAMHRIASDEIWHFYYGDPLEVFEIRPNGSLICHKLGADPDNGTRFQCMVKAGSWFGAAVQEGAEYGLAGCTVAPGFDFDDFELANRNILLNQFPQHKEIITKLTAP